MIRLRPVQKEDLTTLLELGKVPGFFNLPSEPDALMSRIEQSQRSFEGLEPVLERRRFIFVAEENQKVLATAMVASQHGTASSPHFYFQVGQEQRYSSTINTGFIHGTLEMKLDMDGPSELGGLVVDPELRRDPRKIGKLISMVRFQYVAMHPKSFRERFIAELLPPLTEEGTSPLWEAIGRRFTNMDYWEADQLCSKNKEFVLSLFPEGKIYTTFLSADAREAIGKVGKNTLPAVHMLTRIGFTYRHQVDPFDGGPHYWAETKDILPVQETQAGAFSGTALQADVEGAQFGLIASEKKGFQSVAGYWNLQGDGKIQIVDHVEAASKEIVKILDIELGDSLWVTPLR